MVSKQATRILSHRAHGWQRRLRCRGGFTGPRLLHRGGCVCTYRWTAPSTAVGRHAPQAQPRNGVTAPDHLAAGDTLGTNTPSYAGFHADCITLHRRRPGGPLLGCLTGPCMPHAVECLLSTPRTLICYRRCIWRQANPSALRIHRRRWEMTTCLSRGPVHERASSQCSSAPGRVLSSLGRLAPPVLPSRSRNSTAAQSVRVCAYA